MIHPAIIGVDPGANETGIVMRQGDDLWGHYVVVRKGSWSSYFDNIHHLVMSLWSDQTRFRIQPHVAVEDVDPPNPHLGTINPNGLIGTAKVWGSIISSFPDTIEVPTGRNGSGPFSAYPEALRPTRGKGAGKDKLRHARSAWDVAGAAATILKVGAA
jgi:hypothetical protein